MRSNPQHIPTYRLHKPSGQARVTSDGKHACLGKFGSTASGEQYHRLVVSRLNGGSPITANHTPSSRISTGTVPNPFFGRSLAALANAELLRRAVRERAKGVVRGDATA